jgi:DNA repair exonuclease SbcCD ATPase subunit
MNNYLIFKINYNYYINKKIYNKKMYNSHREAFQQKSNSKKPIESNLDSIINQAQTKMKEMILEKQNYQKERNLLLGKERVSDENINSLKSEINDKNDDIKEKEKIFFEIEQNIKNLENEKKLEIKKANEKEAKLKDDINNINEELNRIKDGTIPAQASKTFDLKKNCEEVNELKKKNNQLRETLYLLSRRLYTLEVSHIIIIFNIGRK